MPVGFEASQFSVSFENDVLVVALGAPSTEDDDIYLMFQHKSEFSESDAKFGMDKPYIEFCGQGWSWYGHMLKVQLERNVIKVHMDTDAAQHMQNDGIIEVHFHLHEAQFAELRSALRRTFNGVGYYTDVD
ncbi:MAG: Imm10 family immunity protein [Sideroxydans sp.]|nr:Imm10 family immunity protein [Sideroxydans sp.]